MGIQEKYEDLEKIRVQGLKELNGHFPAFSRAVLNVVEKESDSSRIKEICRSIDLYAAVFYKGIQDDEKIFLLGEEKGIEFNVDVDYNPMLTT